MSLPSSSRLPVPSATTSPSWGFSLWASGMMIPPFLVSTASSGLTSTRSARGRTLTDAMLVWFLLVFGLVFSERRGRQAELRPLTSAFSVKLLGFREIYLVVAFLGAQMVAFDAESFRLVFDGDDKVIAHQFISAALGILIQENGGLA